MSPTYYFLHLELHLCPGVKKQNKKRSFNRMVKVLVMFWLINRAHIVVSSHVQF